MRYQQNMRSFGENKAKTSFLSGQLIGVVVLGLIHTLNLKYDLKKVREPLFNIFLVLSLTLIKNC